MMRSQVRVSSLGSRPTGHDETQAPSNKNVSPSHCAHSPATSHRSQLATAQDTVVVVEVVVEVVVVAVPVTLSRLVPMMPGLLTMSVSTVLRSRHTSSSWRFRRWYRPAHASLSVHSARHTASVTPFTRSSKLLPSNPLATRSSPVASTT